MSVRTLLLLAGASAILTASGAAIAADGSTQATSAKPEKQICRRVSHVGSRLGETTCMTKSEWARFEQESNLRARKTTEDSEYRNNNYINPEQGGHPN